MPFDCTYAELGLSASLVAVIVGSLLSSSCRMAWYWVAPCIQYLLSELLELIPISLAYPVLSTINALIFISFLSFYVLFNFANIFLFTELFIKKLNAGKRLSNFV